MLANNSVIFLYYVMESEDVFDSRYYRIYFLYSIKGRSYSRNFYISTKTILANMSVE